MRRNNESVDSLMNLASAWHGPNPPQLRGSRMAFVLHSIPLTHMSEPARGDAAPGAQGADASADRFERDIIGLLQRLSPRPIEPAPDSELMADLGFDSLRVLELVGEIEDHFRIAVPLNSLTHIRTVRQIAAEVERLVTRGGQSPS